MVRVSSPPQSFPKAVVCVSTPRMYPRSRYFLVSIKFHTAVLCGKNVYAFQDSDVSLRSISCVLISFLKLFTEEVNRVDMHLLIKSLITFVVIFQVKSENGKSFY